MKVLVGIDPGIKTGLAIAEGGKLVRIETVDILDALDEIHAYANEARYYLRNVTIYIEDPSLNKPVFDRGQHGRKALNIAQKVGSNKRDAQILIAKCKRAGVKLVRVKPVAGPFTKMSAEFFKKQTGWTGRTSQHARDAAGLILGR